MRAFPLMASAILYLALAACAAGQDRTGPAAPAYLSINDYNLFSEVQMDNVRSLSKVRELMTREADPQEVYALSLLIRTIETHAAEARNLADLALLAGTGEFAGSPYVLSRFQEAAQSLARDLEEIELQNLALNKSGYKGVSAAYAGYLVDLGELIEVIRADIDKL